MLIFEDGTSIRDIDIEELTINVLGDYGRRITLRKDKVEYENTISPTIGYMNGRLEDDYFQVHFIDISEEGFLELSDAIHRAGLLNISWNAEKENCPGGKYACMRVLFDDGAYYELRMREQNRPKEYDKIVEILNQFCNGKGR